MKIPNSIRIAGVDYDVLYTSKLNNGVNMAYGYISFERNTIELNKELQCHQSNCITLLHEILHGIIHHYGIDIKKGEEAIVTGMSKGLYQVLQDNGAKLFCLAEIDK